MDAEEQTDHRETRSVSFSLGGIKTFLSDSSRRMCVCVCICVVPAVLSAQPHRALVGLRVNAEQVLQTGPGEGAPGGAAHGAAVHGVLRVDAVASPHPQHPSSTVGAGEGELLLLLTAGGLRHHVFRTLTLVI